MIFQNERELQHELANIDFGFLSGHTVAYTRREVPVGECKPDLVSVQLMQEPKIDDSSIKWSYKHSFILWLIRNSQALSFEKIASLTFEPVDRLSLMVQQLELIGLLQKNSINDFVLTGEIKNCQAAVIAVEAKLKNWREALRQAKRYKDFANIVFVAMDASNIPRKNEAVFHFESEQIGLCAIAPGSMDWIVYPPMRVNDLGHEREYLIMSATLPSTQTLWSRR